MNKDSSFKSILKSTERIPFSIKDGNAITDFIKKNNNKGYDIELHPMLTGALQEAFHEGFVIFSSFTLKRDFLLINENSGKGLFGRQKTAVVSFVGSASKDQFTPGPTSKKLSSALTSINKIYSENG